MTIFFTGCTHFGHANIIKLANRPFQSVEEMDAIMIERWNAKVSFRDTVYHLGDFSWSRDDDEVFALLDRLNGTRHLVIGNHDSEAVRRSAGWQTVRSYQEVEGMVLFHYPIEEWNGFYKGKKHLYCHTHSPYKAGDHGVKNRINVTVEAWQYAPASLDEIRTVWL